MWYCYLEAHCMENKMQPLTTWVSLLPPQTLGVQRLSQVLSGAQASGTWPRLWPGLTQELRPNLGQNVGDLGSELAFPRFLPLRETANGVLPILPQTASFHACIWDTNWTYICVVFLNRVNRPLFSDPNKWIRPNGHLLPLWLLDSSKICPTNSSDIFLCRLDKLTQAGFLTQPGPNKTTFLKT